MAFWLTRTITVEQNNAGIAHLLMFIVYCKPIDMQLQVGILIKLKINKRVSDIIDPRLVYVCVRVFIWESMQQDMLLN